MKPCKLCGRTLKTGTTEHHLIPRTCHSNRWFKQRFTREQMRVTVPLCRDCHREIHRLISEKELGRAYNTIPRLLAHPKVDRFVAWVKKQK